jgi:hypothetical protein
VESASQDDDPGLGLATVNIAHDATKDPAPNLHKTSPASANYSREASTDPASTSQEASARPADARDNDCKTSCDHPITVSLAVEFVHKFSKQLYEPPGHVYAEIVRSAQQDVAVQWSDDKVWEDTIRVSFFRSHKHTIFNLLEYIGASEWFEQQIVATQNTCKTKRNDPIQPNTAASKVLDRILGPCDTGAIPEMLARGQQRRQRQRIQLQLTRGRILRNSIVKHLGPGILFSPRVW